MKLRTALVLLVASWLVSVVPSPAQTSVQTRRRTDAQRAKDKEREEEKQRQRSQPEIVTEQTPDGRSTDRRAYRAVFGGASTEPSLRQSVNLTLSASEVYDQNLLADVTGPEVSTVLQESGFYTALVGDLTFRHRGERVVWAASGGTATRYYSSIRKFVASNYHGAAGFSAKTSRASSLTVNQALSYAPVYLLGLFSPDAPATIGSVITPVTNYAANDDRSYTTDTSAAFVHNFSRRASLSLSSSLRHTRYKVVTARGESFSQFDGYGSYLYALKRGMGLRLGYGFRRANYATVALFGPIASQPLEHDIDVGIDYKRALSRTRRTSFGFKGGTSLVSTAVSNDFTRARRLLRIVGDASLAHQMGETWQLTGSYARGSGLVEGLAAPVFSDAFTLASNGFLNRRSDLALSIGYSQGSPQAVGINNNFVTYTGNARFRFAVAPRLALTAEYLYYYYDFSNMLTIAPGLNPTVRRNSVRAGFSLWTPLLRR